MTDGNEEVLRQSLNAVDRHRNRLLIGAGGGVVLLVFALVQGADAIQRRDTNRLLHAVMLILAMWTAVWSLVVVVQMTVMTKRILRAIELAARK